MARGGGVSAGFAATLTAPYRSAWRHRVVVRELSWREVQAAFRGSLLGSTWFVLQPLAMLAVYALVFGGIIGLGRDITFVVSLFTGMVVFQAFSDPVGRAPRLVVAQPNYVTKVVFPLDVLPWPLVALAAMHTLTSTVLLLALQAIVATPTWTALLLPLLIVPVLAIGLGVSWLLAAIGVYVRDTHEVVRVVVQLLFFVSPIVWTSGMLPADSWTSWLVVANPIAVAIEAARAALTGTAWPPAPAIVWLFVCAAILPPACHALFRRIQDGFADVL
jgi:lipopolysaccharide transport system permease protein